MKKTLFILLFIGATSVFSAPKMAVTVGMTNFWYYSLEVEGYIKLGYSVYFNPGGGYGINPFQASYLQHLIPHHATFNFGFGNSRHFLEVGYKGAIGFDGGGLQTNGTYNLGFLMGYRHHGRSSGLVFKAYIAPGAHFDNGASRGDFLWGVNLGGRF